MSLLTAEQEAKVARYVEAWQQADTPKKRAWLLHQAAERDEAIVCDVALLRSTYRPEPPRCPSCRSPQPHLHPGTGPCPDRFHVTVTEQNTPARIAKVQALLIELSKRDFAERSQDTPTAEETETANEAAERIRAEDMMGGLTG